MSMLILIICRCMQLFPYAALPLSSILDPLPELGGIDKIQQIPACDRIVRFY